jgi:hypothetical protein
VAPGAVLLGYLAAMRDEPLTLHGDVGRLAQAFQAARSPGKCGIELQRVSPGAPTTAPLL